MRYLALVTDYDGVIATEGRASRTAISAIQSLQMSGRRAILNSGRRLEDLLTVFPEAPMFDGIVAENGAVYYEPRTRKETLLGKPPPREFINRLKQLGVDDLDLGRVMVATWMPHHVAVLRAIQELGLELQIIFNRSAVMVLPAGVNKATGMDFALRRLGLSAHEVVGLGDSENDHSFLERSECAVALANALPSVKAIAAITTKGHNGDGVAELVDELVATDLERLHGRLSQHLFSIGRRADGSEVMVPPYGLNMLIAGPSGSGKSTVTAGIIERLMLQNYQVCVVDPEGDYGTLQDVITIGNQNHAVSTNEVLAILEDPKINLNINLLGTKLADRPEFFGRLFPTLQAMRTRTGRPHWIILDEAHHMVPAKWAHLAAALPQRLGETILITVHPDLLPPALLNLVDIMIAVGPSPQETVKKLAAATDRAMRWPKGSDHKHGQVVAWMLHESDAPFSMNVIPGTTERIRHHRKYAKGDMRDRSFYFQGPHNQHNIRAQNLFFFSQIAEGIDEETWMFHLRRGDYSRWFRDSVKDNYLAEHAQKIERRQDLRPAETRELICGLIEARYTLGE